MRGRGPVWPQLVAARRASVTNRVAGQRKPATPATPKACVTDVAELIRHAYPPRQALQKTSAPFAPSRRQTCSWT